MNASSVAIVRIGMTSALGLSALQTAASVRAGLSGYRKSSILDADEERITMALVPEADLPPLSPELNGASLTGRTQRLLRLATLSLPECLVDELRPERIPLLIAVPDAFPGLPAPIGADFLDRLAQQSGVVFDVQHSRVFPHGRAGGLLALHEALTRLRAGSVDRVVVGGVDSHLDLMLLAMLVEERRLRADGIYDGFTPGEGAAFLLLMRADTAAREGREVLTYVDEAASADEPGHRYSEEPYRGEGLDLAFRRAFTAMSSLGPVRTVYAGFNGEHFPSKEWGVAHLRHRARFAEDVRIEHPADCLGDVGAAFGPMMMGLAAIGMQRGYRRSPCLVWCSSDKAERAAALLHKA